jgi:xylulokinase
VAAELHLRPDTEVALSSYDAIVSVVGSGVGEEGTLCDVSGTVTSVRMQCRDARTHPTGAIACQGMPSLGCHYLGGSNNLGGGLIEWLKTTFYPASPHVYDMIQTDAQGVTAQDSRIVFLPYLMGERAPIWNPDARGVFFGVERMHSRKHFARATLEAAAFAGRTLIEAVGEAYGRPPAKVRLSGGLSRLEICSRIKADVYGLPLEIVSEFESTVLGAHLLAFHRRLGLTPGSRGWLDATVKVRDIVIPDDEAKATYDESFLMFKEIYAALQPVFLRHSHRTAKTMKSEDGYLENL